MTKVEYKIVELPFRFRVCTLWVLKTKILLQHLWVISKS